MLEALPRYWSIVELTAIENVMGCPLDILVPLARSRISLGITVMGKAYDSYSSHQKDFA
jgi:hypothetical protein